MNDSDTELKRLVADTRRRLELESEYGMDSVPVSPQRVRAHADRRRARRASAPAQATPAAPAQVTGARHASPLQTAVTQPPSAAAVTGVAADKAARLDALRQEFAECCACGLGKTRTKLVFGAGNPDARIMFIGEAPGADEDASGIPFVGRAGKLLTQIIEAMGLTRETIYIANVLKCRPPDNRAPAPDEVAACLPTLRRQIEIIAPQIIVTLGNPATQNLLETTEGITRLRGRFTKWNGIEVMPTFHPSYLLRNPPAKREVWEDMKAVHARARELGIAIGPLKTRAS